MARRANLSADENDEDDLNTAASPTRQRQGHVNVDSLSPSPAASFSSDKENRQAQVESSRQSKGKGRATGRPQLPTPTATVEDDVPRSSKRRKLSERDVPNATQTAHENALAGISDARYYDPDQSIEERRALRKDYRDLSKELTGMSRF